MLSAYGNPQLYPAKEKEMSETQWQKYMDFKTNFYT
jgi:hypothetical protein